MKKMGATALSTLAGGMLLVLLLYLAVASVAFDEGQYIRSPAPYDAMAEQLVGYLRGQTAGLSDLYTGREKAHMADVLALFQGGRTLALLCGVFAAMFLGLAGILGGRSALRPGLLAGYGIVLGLLAGLGVWAAVDFSGFFYAMHEIVFTNDLWLLDPADSMLIRMMPLSFFIRVIRTILVRFSLGATALGTLTFFLLRTPKGRAAA